MLRKHGLNGLKLKIKKDQYDYVAKNIITFALNMDEFFRVSPCNFVKEM